MSQWISVDERLPEKGQWVIVYRDDADNPQDLFWAKHFGHETTLVTAATLRSVDNEGYADWQQGELSSGRALSMVRNVTHWMPLPEAPQ